MGVEWGGRREEAPHELKVVPYVWKAFVGVGERKERGKGRGEMVGVATTFIWALGLVGPRLTSSMGCVCEVGYPDTCLTVLLLWKGTERVWLL